MYAAASTTTLYFTSDGWRGVADFLMKLSGGSYEALDTKLALSAEPAYRLLLGAPDLEATAKAYEELADEVPEEIRDAFKTVAAAFSTYADALKDAGLTPGQVPDADALAKLAEAAKGFDNTELTAATAEIEAWVKKNCTTGG